MRHEQGRQCSTQRSTAANHLFVSLFMNGCDTKFVRLTSVKPQICVSVHNLTMSTSGIKMALTQMSVRYILFTGVKAKIKTTKVSYIAGNIARV